jgi:hypothetical protein
MKQNPLNNSMYKQRGAALIILALIFIITVTLVMINNRSRNQSKLEQQDNVNQILEAALQELIGFAMQNNDVPGMLPFPDRNADPEGYDGLSDCSNNPLPLPPAILIGRFPYRGQGAGGDGCTSIPASFDISRSHEPLHYVVSPNLIQFNNGTYRNTINANVLAQLTGWLTVYDAQGNATPNVAFIIFYPGKAVTTVSGYVQNRSSALAGPAEYLDAFDLPPPLSRRIDNANPTAALEFVMAPESDTFNDQLVFVTADQLLNNNAMRRAESRFLNRIATQLGNDFNAATFPVDQATLTNVSPYNAAPYVHWLSSTSINTYNNQINGAPPGYDSFTYTRATTCNGTNYGAVVFGSTQLSPRQCAGAN